jgi:hypothetical protein
MFNKGVRVGLRQGDRRPNCVVLDEIDGVMNGSEGRGTIDQLLKLIRVHERGGGGAAPGAHLTTGCVTAAGCGVGKGEEKRHTPQGRLFLKDL